MYGFILILISKQNTFKDAMTLSQACLYVGHIISCICYLGTCIDFFFKYICLSYGLDNNCILVYVEIIIPMDKKM